MRPRDSTAVPSFSSSPACTSQCRRVLARRDALGPLKVLLRGCRPHSAAVRCQSWCTGKCTDLSDPWQKHTAAGLPTSTLSPILVHWRSDTDRFTWSAPQSLPMRKAATISKLLVQNLFIRAYTGVGTKTSSSASCSWVYCASTSAHARLVSPSRTLVCPFVTKKLRSLGMSFL